MITDQIIRSNREGLFFAIAQYLDKYPVSKYNTYVLITRIENMWTASCFRVEQEGQKCAVSVLVGTDLVKLN